MTTDRDLQLWIVAAAKVMGYEIVNTRMADPMWHDTHVKRPDREDITRWAPHANSGQAFELAVALKLTVMPGIARDGEGRLCIGRGRDPLESTRYAILQCAALGAPK